MARGKNRFGRGDILAGLRSCLKVQEKCGIGKKACPFSREACSKVSEKRGIRDKACSSSGGSVRKCPKNAESETRRASLPEEMFESTRKVQNPRQEVFTTTAGSVRNGVF